MTKENITIKFEKVVAETVTETDNLVSFDFTIDILVDFITDYFDTAEEFYENFKIVFTNAFSNKNMVGTKKRDEKMPKFTLVNDEHGNFYRTNFRYDYLLPKDSKSYKLSYHYELSLASLRQKYGYSLTEPPDVVGAESRQVPIFEAGEFQAIVQDMTGLQTFGELPRFVSPPKLTEILQLDKILYKTAKSDNWHGQFVTARSEDNYVFHCIVDAERFMNENFRLNSFFPNKLSKTESMLNVYATAVEGGMVLSVVKTRLGGGKLLVSIKATTPAIKVTFAFKDDSKEIAQKILNAISVGPEAALESGYLDRFVDKTRVLELLTDPKYYQKIKEGMEEFAYQLLLAFPDLTAQTQSQTLYTTDPGFRTVEIYARHENKANAIRLSLGNDRRQDFESYRQLADKNTKAIFGEQKTFYTTETGFEGNVDLTKLMHLNLPMKLIDSVEGAKSYENPIELFYDMLTGKELSIQNSVNLLAAENSIGVFKNFEGQFSLFPNLIDVFSGTAKTKEDNSAEIDELPLDGLENYFAELLNVNLTGDADWLNAPKKYFTDKPLTEGLFLPNSIKYLISRNVLKNTFERFDGIFFEPGTNSLRKFLYPIFFLKYLFVFEVEFYNTAKERWESLTESVLLENPENIFCRIRRYENKKYIPEELFKKFRKELEINNKYFILSR